MKTAETDRPADHPRKCPKCDTELREAVLNGQCPVCLVKVMRESDAGEPAAVSDSLSVQSAISHRPSSIESGTFRYFGDYELLAEIGRGGMGVVYRARQISLNRTVALKLIGPAQLTSPKAIERFHTEAKAAASLDHPNIVPIYETGDCEGRHYFSMKLIEGQSLAQRISDFRLTIDESKGRQERLALSKSQIVNRRSSIVSLVAKVASAVHYAHQRGILHRDLKPGNILIDANGEPHVTDFGLARNVENDSSLTLSGEVIGTPAYMAPEQAAGKVRQITTAADVYGLGVILYELLTGQPPFRCETAVETLHAVVHHDPPRPRLLNPTAPRDLETICLKCLEKEASKRYASAQELADELRRFERGEPIHARAISPPEKVWRWCKRKPALAASLVLLNVVLAAGLAGVLWQWRRAENNAADARRKELMARENLYFADIRMAYHDWESGQITRMLNELRRHIPQGSEPDRRGWEWYYLLSLCHREERTLRGHSGPVVSCDAAGRRFASASEDRTVRIWDIESGASIAELVGHENGVCCVAWNPDGSQLASGGRDGKLILWNTVTSQKLFVLDCDKQVLSLAWSPDGKRIAAGDFDGLVTIWDAASGERLYYLAGNVGMIRSLAWQPAGHSLVAGENYLGRMQVWDADSGRLLHTLDAHGHFLASLSWSPDGRRLASCSADQRIKIWDADTWKSEITIDPAHNGAVAAIAWSKDGQRLVSGGYDGIVKIWNPTTGSQMNVLRGHQGAVTAVAWWETNGRVLSGSQDGTVKLWNPEAEQAAFTLTASTACAWSPDGRQIAVGTARGTTPRSAITVLDVATWQPLLNLPGATNSDPISLAWSPDARWLAACYWAGLVQVWNVATRKQILTLPRAHGGMEVRTVAWSPKGRLLATAGGDAVVRLWNVETKENILTFPEHSNSVASAVWSPSGRRIASKDFDGGVMIWDSSTGQVIHKLRCPVGFSAGRQYDVGWSPQGDRLAAAGADGTVMVWDTATGGQIHALKGHTSTVRSVHWSPDGRRLVSGSEDRTIRIWDAQAGRELLVLPDPPNVYPMLAWSSSGRMIAAASRSLMIFDATIGYAVAPQISTSQANQ